MKLSVRNLLKLILVPALLAPAQGAFSQTTSGLSDANQAYAAGQYAKAARLYRAVLQGDPQNAKAYQGLGNSEYAQGNKGEALAAYDKSLALNPDNPKLAGFVQGMKAQGVTEPAAAAQPAPKANANRGGQFDWNGPEWNISLGPAFGSGGTGIGVDDTYYFVNGSVFALGVAGNVYLFGLDTSNVTYCGEALLQFRVAFGDGPIKPYVLGGGGFNAIYSTNAFSTSGSGQYISFVTDPEVVGGAGVLFSLNRYFRLYLQGKASVVFLSGDTTTIANGGFTQSVSGGGTLTYYPVEFGMAISL